MNEETAPDMSRDGGGAGMGITALVLGIIAFFPGCCLSGFYGNWILAVLAIIFGVAGMNGSKASLAKAGLVLGIIALILYIILTVVGVSYEDQLQEWIQQQEAAQEGGGNSNNGNNDIGNKAVSYSQSTN